MSTDLLHRERQVRIRSLLAESGKVLAVDLAERFGVSEDTVRRDLREMAARGECERVYGGALSLEPRHQSMSVRMTVAGDRKAALAASAASFVSARMTIFMDAGSTNLAIARALPDGLKLTVITNAPDIALELANRSETIIVLAGGTLDPHCRAIVGGQAISQLTGIRPDLSILGVCGLTAEAGLTAISYEDSAIKRLMANQSGAVLVAATNEKFGITNPWPVCPSSGLTHLVAEHDLPEPILTAFAATGAGPVRALPPT